MKLEAKKVLMDAGIEKGQDFNSLTATQLAAVRSEAEAAYERKHGKPMPPDNSTFLRKRYDLLQIRART